MTDKEKDKIINLRKQGYGYKAISNELGLSRDTIKSFCRRNGLLNVEVTNSDDRCRECGKPISQIEKMKKKKFCCDDCRKKWWSEHLDQINRKTAGTVKCKCCGTRFKAYGSAGRKYCSHDCYIKDRFGGGGDE